MIKISIIKLVKRMLLSIVVPVFNEEENIEKFYEEVVKSLNTLDMDYEIIYVDDGSRIR